MLREVTKKDSASLVAAHKKEAEEAPSKIEPAEPVRKPPATTTVKAEPSRPRLNDHRNGDAPADNFPAPMAEEAFHGIAGEICEILEPQTEGSMEAILLQLLVGFGSMVGRGPRVYVGQDAHRCNEFFGVVGETAQSRKGSGLQSVLSLLYHVDPIWEECLRPGLQSGEALIKSLRDPSGDPESDGYDAGVADKRGCMMEEELTRLLIRAASGTFTEQLRPAWDGGKF